MLSRAKLLPPKFGVGCPAILRIMELPRYESEGAPAGVKDATEDGGGGPAGVVDGRSPKVGSPECLWGV